tara:strand:+ start:1998 stop:2108 length:111 start_codon:yes stop_codon:yes gene_type:complete
MTIARAMKLKDNAWYVGYEVVCTDSLWCVYIIHGHA